MNGGKYRIEVEMPSTDGKTVWIPLKPARGKPYEYDTREEAEKTMRDNFPDECRLGPPEGLRVVAVGWHNDEWTCPVCHTMYGKNLRNEPPFGLVAKHQRTCHE